MLTPQPLEPPAPYHGMSVSEADYWLYYYDSNEPTFEWNNGVLEEKGVSDWETAKLFFLVLPTIERLFADLSLRPFSHVRDGVYLPIRRQKSDPPS